MSQFLLLFPIQFLHQHALVRLESARQLFEHIVNGQYKIRIDR